MGRLGNFINAELWGRETDVAWAMVFPTDKLQLPRHPSQLYEFALEGVVLFAILYIISRKTQRLGLASGVFLIGYGVFRSIVEFFREPDAHLGLYFSFISKGQILSIPMILAGIFIIYIGYLIQQKTAISEGENKNTGKTKRQSTKKSIKGSN
jgi:phosphatidylglycerol:prolipoprotein diacylglycerol transferase